MVNTGLGAVSGAAAAGLGVLVLAPFSPPVAVTVVALTALGAVSGYRWGSRIHGAWWQAFLDAISHRGP